MARPFATARSARPWIWAAAAMLCAAGVQAQDIYKWVDASGVTQYTSAPPPPGVPATRLHTAPSPSPVAASQARAEARRQADEQDRRTAERQRELAQQQVRVEAARRALDPGMLVAGIPYARFLGISAELADGELVGRMRFSERLIGNPVLPALHGGTVGALLEITGLMTVVWTVEGTGVPKIINLTIDYLRSAAAEDVFAQGLVTKQGRRVVNVLVRAWQRDRERPVASANAHFLIGMAGAEDPPAG